MFAPDQYELLDFGEGRRLERFGEVVLNRPCPTVEGTRKSNPSLWQDVDAVFVFDAAPRQGEPGRGYWKPVLTEPPPIWTISVGAFELELKLTPFGHVGLFPEQATNWKRIGEMLAQRPGARVLNLFGYTGASTLAAVAAGAEVTHVDAAKNIVEWAKRNAEHSDLAARPIRWIAEDAPKFVRRELRRGCRYDAIILDPPTYGHGSKGEVWRFSKHLPGLLRDCFSILNPEPLFLLLTSHTPGFDSPRLANIIRATSQISLLSTEDTRIRGFRMSLTSATGKRLSCGTGATFFGKDVTPQR